jgi:hypothetical protein
MNSHESIRAMLPLAAAGVMPLEEMAIVEQHASTCPGCHRELELLRLYTRGLQDMPQPVLPAGLMRRTRARLIQEQEKKEARRRQALTLSLLVLFSWATGLVSWLLVRAVTGGVLSIFGINLVAVGIWSLMSVLLAWATAGVAAIVMGKRDELVRKFL